MKIYTGGSTHPSCTTTATATPTLTTTPGPSPTPTNTSIATATFTPTPTQILPLFSNADFTYDGNGKRVKSIITTNVGTTTTCFVGAHYEVADGVVTNYYYAGSQRIALRVNGTLNYLLGDHLGSTSLTTDANGQVVSELRYTAWGETRYASGSTSTKYTYTGQYSYAGEFGLHYYNARWYDSYITQFSQPDSIIPDPYNPQDWNRYAYVRYNPIRNIDPSGHRPCDDVDAKGNCIDLKTSIKNHIQSKYKVNIKGPWDEDELFILNDSLNKLAAYAGGADGLNNVLLDGLNVHDSGNDRVTLKNTPGNSAPCKNGGYACWNNSDTIFISDFVFTAEYQNIRQKRPDAILGAQETIAHEIVHVFADSRPWFWTLVLDLNDPTPIWNTLDNCMGACLYEENMAGLIAKYVITGKASSGDHLEFILDIQDYWATWP